MLGAQIEAISTDVESNDATQVFCEELNKRSIMPMELMQARANPKFAETAERVFNEYQAMKVAIQKTVQYVKDRQNEIGEFIGFFYRSVIPFCYHFGSLTLLKGLKRVF